MIRSLNQLGLELVPAHRNEKILIVE